VVRIVCPPIVLDTNVLVAGACRHASSPAYRLLLAVLQKRVAMIITEPIICEYLDVLLRLPVRKQTGLTVKQSNDLVLELISLSYMTQLHFSWRPNLLDESDNKFVEAAIHGSAIIVTYNVRDFANRELLKYGWDVMTPVDLMTRYDVEK